jgi:tetratricopeptide (TPR) repeat protein
MASSLDIEKQPPRTLTQLASALLSMGDAPGAVQILRRARERHPDDVWVNLELSTALSKLRPPRYAESARYLRAALAARPGSDQIRLSLGITLAAGGEWRGAAHAWRVLIARTPDDANLHAYLAEALSRLGDLDGARGAAMRSLELSPRNWLSWSALLDVLALRADAAVYLVKCKEASASFPGTAIYLAHSARAAARNGDHVKALALAEEALERDSTDPLACLVMGSLLLDRGDADRAVEVLQVGTKAALTKASNVQAAELEQLFVRALEVTGELDKTKTALQARVRSNPGDVGARWGLAGVHRIQHHFADELQLRRRIAELAPYEPQAHKELGDHLRDRLGRFREAEAAYRRSIALRPETARYHAALGHALALQGRTKESLDACERARQLDALDFESRLTHVLVLKMARRKGEALKAAADAAKSAPDLCGALVAAGAAQLEVGDLEGAEESLEKAVAIAPRSPSAQRLLGRVRFRRADLAGAEQILSVAVSQRPRDVRARLALASVHEAQGKLEESLGGFRQVQSLARSFAKGYAGEAWMRGRSGMEALSKPDDLLRLAQQAVDLDPRDGVAWRSLALAHFLGGDAEPAGEACAQALASGLDDNAAAEILFLRAMVATKLNREAKARNWFQQGLGRMEKADGPSRDREALRAQAAKLVGAEGN